MAMTLTGEPGVVARAYLAEAGRVIALARLLTGDAGAGEDLAHEAFLTAVRLERERPGNLREPAWPWLRVTVVRLAARWRTRRALELRRLVGLHEPPKDEQWSAATYDLLRALRELPHRMRACVVLFHLEDLTTADVAAALGCAERTVETQLRAGRRRLAVALRDRDNRADATTPQGDRS